jgi:hypothetical protein
MCYVVKGMAQSSISGNITVTWNASGAELDTGGMYNAAQPTRMTAPTSGWYKVTSKVSQTGTTAWTTTTQVNGVSNIQSGVGDVGAPGAATRPETTTLIALNAGDYVETVLAATSVVALNPSACWFMMEWARVRQS